MPPREAAR